MSIEKSSGLAPKKRLIGGNARLDSHGNVVEHTGAREDTRERRQGGEGRQVTIDGKTRTHEKLLRVQITGEDMKHAKDILREVFPKTADRAKENIEKQRMEQRDGDWIRFNNEAKLRLSADHAENSLAYMRRHLPKGPPAVRPTFFMGARLVNGKLVRSEEE